MEASQTGYILDIFPFALKITVAMTTFARMLNRKNFHFVLFLTYRIIELALWLIMMSCYVLRQRNFLQ